MSQENPVDIQKKLLLAFLSVYMKLDHRGMSSEEFSSYVARHLFQRFGEYRKKKPMRKPYGQEFISHVVSVAREEFPTDRDNPEREKNIIRQRQALKTFYTSLLAFARPRTENSEQK
jgi:hypothetical protein